MSGEQIILLLILAIVIGAGFYVAGEVRDAFRDPYGDSPFIHPELRRKGTATRKDSGGRETASNSGPARKRDARTHRGDGL